MKNQKKKHSNIPQTHSTYQTEKDKEEQIKDNKPIMHKIQDVLIMHTKAHTSEKNMKTTYNRHNKT